MTLRELTIRAGLGLSGSQFWTWFDGARLQGDALIVPSDEQRQDIQRLFGEQLTAANPALRILYEPPRVPTVSKPSAIKKSAPAEVQKLWR